MSRGEQETQATGLAGLGGLAGNDQGALCQDFLEAGCRRRWKSFGRTEASPSRHSSGRCTACAQESFESHIKFRQEKFQYRRLLPRNFVQSL